MRSWSPLDRFPAKSTRSAGFDEIASCRMAYFSTRPNVDQACLMVAGVSRLFSTPSAPCLDCCRTRAARNYSHCLAVMVATA